MTSQQNEQDAGDASYCYPAIASAAEALLGADKHRDLARVLGAHHPDGPKECIDDRLVRRWSSGERPVPAWVPAALSRLLKQQASAMLAAAAALEAATAPKQSRPCVETPASTATATAADAGIREGVLRNAGRTIGKYMSPDTSRRLDELARVAGKSGSGRLFKGSAADLARDISRRVGDDLRSRGASPGEVGGVNRAFATLGKATTGLDLAPLFEGLKGAERPA